MAKDHALLRLLEERGLALRAAARKQAEQLRDLQRRGVMTRGPWAAWPAKEDQTVSPAAVVARVAGALRDFGRVVGGRS